VKVKVRRVGNIESKLVKLKEELKEEQQGCTHTIINGE
jgi:hypothetical protein